MAISDFRNIQGTIFIEPNGLCHSGIKGMKWGVRRYQNKDGTLTPAGRARYNAGFLENTSRSDREAAKFLESSIMSKKVKDIESEKIKHGNHFLNQDQTMLFMEQTRLFNQQVVSNQEMINQINQLHWMF